jgi:hypothetical protein
VPRLDSQPAQARTEQEHKRHQEERDRRRADGGVPASCEQSALVQLPETVPQRPGHERAGADPDRRLAGEDEHPNNELRRRGEGDARSRGAHIPQQPKRHGEGRDRRRYHDRRDQIRRARITTRIALDPAHGSIVPREWQKVGALGRLRDIRCQDG